MDLKKFRIECKNKNYPIMEDSSLDKIIEYIKDGDQLLEIGACVGYSSIYIASHRQVNIITIERDDQRALEAINNLANYDEIELIHLDALEYTPNQQFDVIIFDAAKAQNLKFLDRFLPYLKESGLIFVDNVHFHGYVKNPELIKHQKNKYSMVMKMRQFIETVQNDSKYSTEIFDVGDGVLKISL